MMRWGLVLGLLVAPAAACGDDDVAPGEDGGADADADSDADADVVDAGGGDGGGDFPGDELLPWEGGPEYYAQFAHGPPSDPSFFPIAVWLQSPANAERYRALGVNLFVGLWEGPTDDQLATLAAAGMPVACDQNTVGLEHIGDDGIVAWTHQDEPDNAQALPEGGYGPCIEREQIVQLYETMRAADGTRPVYLNLGQGVAYEDYIGRGVCSGHLEHYAEYAAGADIVSFDIYPVNSEYDPVRGNPWFVAQGIDRLREAVGYAKPVWNWLECTRISATGARPTPAQVEAEVWMSLVHGSRGIGYFVHEFDPFDETGLLDDAEMAAEVTRINELVTSLAPALNQPSVGNGVTVATSDPEVPVDTMLKRLGRDTYLFAVAMREGETSATFTLRDFPGSATAEVLGEQREIAVASGVFEDTFAPWAVHRYRIAGE